MRNKIILGLLLLTGAIAMAITRVPLSMVVDKGFIDIRDFGAVKGGDISSALSSAITQALSSGTTVGIFEGPYVMATPVAKTITGNLVIISDGSLVTCTGMASATDGAAINITGSGSATAKIFNLNLAYPTATTTRNLLSGVRLYLLDNAEISNCQFDGFPMDGLMLKRVGAASVRDCISTDNNFAGVFVQGSSNVTISGGIFARNCGWNGGTMEGYGVTFATNDVDGVNNYNGKIQGITSLHNGKGIDAHNCSGLVVSNNFIRGFRYNGVYSVSESSSKIVSDVRITGNQLIAEDSAIAPISTGLQLIQAGSFGTAVASFGHLIVSNNVVDCNSISTGSYAILIGNGSGSYGVDSVSILGNRVHGITKSTLYPLHFDNDTTKIRDIYISGNVFEASAQSLQTRIQLFTNAVVTDNVFTVGAASIAYGLSFSGTNVICKNNRFVCPDWTKDISSTGVSALKLQVAGNVLNSVLQPSIESGLVHVQSFYPLIATGSPQTILIISGLAGGNIEGNVSFLAGYADTESVTESWNFNEPFRSDGVTPVVFAATTPRDIASISGRFVNQAGMTGDNKLYMVQSGTTDLVIQALASNSHNFQASMYLDCRIKGLVSPDVTIVP